MSYEVVTGLTTFIMFVIGIAGGLSMGRSEVVSDVARHFGITATNKERLLAQLPDKIGR